LPPFPRGEPAAPPPPPALLEVPLPPLPPEYAPPFVTEACLVAVPPAPPEPVPEVTDTAFEPGFAVKSVVAAYVTVAMPDAMLIVTVDPGVTAISP
jgi:hypothetical protein